MYVIAEIFPMPWKKVLQEPFILTLIRYIKFKNKIYKFVLRFQDRKFWCKTG
jgi:hypothetical protein